MPYTDSSLLASSNFNYFQHTFKIPLLIRIECGLEPQVRLQSTKATLNQRGNSGKIGQQNAVT